MPFLLGAPAGNLTEQVAIALGKYALECVDVIEVKGAAVRALEMRPTRLIRADEVGKISC
jgi:hypothetical protein